MGIFSIFKKQKQTTNNKNCEFEAFAKKNCATAIEYAKDFNKNFDYSKNSIIDLEEILDFYSNDIYKSKPTENQIWSMSIIFGLYLGETMLRNGLSEKGYQWGQENSSNIPLLIKGDGCYITPIDKVYKRLVNGSEDNVVSFYKFAIKYSGIIMVRNSQNETTQKGGFSFWWEKRTVRSIVRRSSRKGAITFADCEVSSTADFSQPFGTVEKLNGTEYPSSVSRGRLSL